MKTLLSITLALLVIPTQANIAKAADEKTEPVVTNTMTYPADAEWKHSFDTIEGERGKANGMLRTALFLYSMLEDEGVDPERVKVAVVVHGSATFDFVSDARYAEHYGNAKNPNKALVSKLIAKGGEIWMSGFGMKFRNVSNNDLLPGIGVAPAALVAHAELQRRGFGLHPK